MNPASLPGFGSLNVARPFGHHAGLSANPAVYGHFGDLLPRRSPGRCDPHRHCVLQGRRNRSGHRDFGPCEITADRARLGSPRSITATYIGDSVYGRGLLSVLFQTNTATTGGLPSVTVASKTYDGTVNATLANR